MFWPVGKLQSIQHRVYDVFLHGLAGEEQKGNRPKVMAAECSLTLLQKTDVKSDQGKIHHDGKWQRALIKVGVGNQS